MDSTTVKLDGREVVVVDRQVFRDMLGDSYEIDPGIPV